jgi:hypothetical protein
MKKHLLVLPVFFLSIIASYAQISASPFPQIDAAVKEIAENIHKKLIEEKAGKIAVGQFSYGGTAVPLGTYLINQLTDELTNKPQRPYVILSGGSAGADMTITGEIIDAANVIRVYTRLVRTEDRAIEGSFHLDLERNEHINAMLASGDGHSSSVLPDSLEPDSFDNPVPYEIGVDNDVPVMNRTLHTSDEDFFLLIPDSDGRLIMETTGNVDTYMEFYNAETREKLAEDDDGGAGYNARIRYNVQAGKRYIAKVRGYGRSDTGSYGFRAYLSAQPSGNFDNPSLYEIGNNSGIPVVNRTLQYDDEHFFLLIPESEGQLVMETTGNVDTYMEFYNAETREKLAENDDGGSNGNARIRYNVQAGKRYIAKVRGYGSGDTGDYGFRAYIQVQVRLAPDEYEPDNDPASAKQIEIGKPQRHTFHSPDDVDWVKFQITRPGRYTIRTRGVNSNRLDTYIELYNSNLNSIGEDDDGGEDLDSRLSIHLENGLYYLKVECLNDDIDQAYTISIEAE